MRIALKSIIIITIIVNIIYANNECIEKGKIVYDKNIKKICHISAYSLAEKHTQNEWEEINNKHKLISELEKICKNNNINLDENSIFNLYNFLYKYASDGDGGGCGF